MEEWKESTERRDEPWEEGGPTHLGAWGAALWGEECGRNQTTPMWFGH